MKKTIKIRIKINAGTYWKTLVRLNGQLSEYPSDLRLCCIHPEDFNLLKKINFPKKLHRTNYE